MFALLPLIGVAASAQIGSVATSFSVLSGMSVETDGTTVSGSAPLEIYFTSEPPEEATYYLWEISTDTDFQNVILRYNESSFSHIFNDYGNCYVRFFCADSSGEKEWVGDVFTINIYESSLECPNAFTPYGSPGINDEWKVMAQSITEFDCVIFNRWGNEIARMKSVDQGWDGRYKGKLVSPGVYFYVISARGADGRQYKLSGDINLIGKRQ